MDVLAASRLCKICKSYDGPIEGLNQEGMAGTTGLEPATSDVTGRRSNQLSYVPA
jgi:hypothetical protein